MSPESAPDTTNVVYIDEYPHLDEKLRLQRLSRPALRATLKDMQNLLVFERMPDPDGAA